MSAIGNILIFSLSISVLPPVLLGTIRKVKARLQGRVGASLIQPIFDICKLMRKGSVVSKDASQLFQAGSVIILAQTLVLMMMTPWLPFVLIPALSDCFLVIYLFAFARLILITSAMDTGSAFGAFGASREATLSVLTEPSVVLALLSLCIVSGTTNLSQTFAFTPTLAHAHVEVWLLAGAGIFLAALVELSRMPIDDPTTHLELTMVHEAMAIERSGRNLAFLELAHCLKLALFLGLSAQCFLHALPFVNNENVLTMSATSILLCFILAMAIGVWESISVKLGWRKAPEFIAYSITFSLLACLDALRGGF